MRLGGRLDAIGMDEPLCCARKEIPLLEPPDIQEQLIIDSVEENYGLPVNSLTFLPLCLDVNTAVFRMEASGTQVYFIKLRKGAFNEITVSVAYANNNVKIVGTAPGITIGPSGSSSIAL